MDPRPIHAFKIGCSSYQPIPDCEAGSSLRCLLGQFNPSKLSCKPRASSGHTKIQILRESHLRSQRPCVQAGLTPHLWRVSRSLMYICSWSYVRCRPRRITGGVPLLNNYTLASYNDCEVVVGRRSSVVHVLQTNTMSE